MVSNVFTQSDVEVETLNTELCVWILEIFHGDLKVSMQGKSFADYLDLEQLMYTNNLFHITSEMEVGFRQLLNCLYKSLSDKKYLIIL